MQDPFYDPIWNALHTAHQPLALATGEACKYAQNVAPFAAVQTNTPAALDDLRSLMKPGESTWLFHDPPPSVTGLTYETSLPCLQMLFPADTALPAIDSTATILPLEATHAPEMVALTDVAFPGFFRPRTHVMGSYFGIREGNGQLVAMCGERIIATAEDGTVWREISGLCTHPDHRGHGYGTLLLRRLIEFQRGLDAVSILHVASSNTNAIALYHHLGFNTLREVTIHKVVRTD
ncbi:GNAT family N-acetyltransferase [Granulicella paludicola]|uniref:GNAT family N-acetyltransferase n=1 Tax=Granulicella paludicola TaxID=474951 RepID=UPI0021E0C1CB|nr:GNAT family N-acetyltransferase [Granulicella paludicola]